MRKESSLYSPILDFLNLQPKTVAWQHYNGGVYDPYKKCYRKKSNYQKQKISDILGVTNGKPFCFEVKADGEEPTQEQREWMEKFTRCGGCAFVVDSLNDVIEAFKEVKF